MVLFLKLCFQRNLEINSLLCPLCKKRVGTWARRKKPHELINWKLWEQIRINFPERVAQKAEGVEENAEELEELFPCLPTHQYAERGQIKAEFDSEIQRRSKEVEERQRQEEEASRELIKSLVQEDKAAARAVTPARPKPKLSKQKTLDGFFKAGQKVNENPRRGEGTSGSAGVIQEHQKETSLIIDGTEMSPELVAEQKRAMEQLEKLKRDEEMAKRLQEQDFGQRTPLATRSPCNRISNSLKRKSSSLAGLSPGGSKKLKQLSLSETFSQSNK